MYRSRGSENVLNVLYIIPAYKCTRLHIAWLHTCTVHVDGRVIMCYYCYIYNFKDLHLYLHVT